MRSKYRIINEEGVYFITSTIIEWIPIFTNRKYFDIIINAFKFSQVKKGLKIYAYIILDNHFHAIVSHPELSRVIQSIKSFTAKEIVSELEIDKKQWALNIFKYQKKPYKEESLYQAWQEGVHPQLIQNQEMFNQKVQYTHFNAVERGLVQVPEHWYYSSASAFAGASEIPLKIDVLE
jgi:REP element-mobilizing transposase RayT